jgi:hypothetical protein
VQTAPDAREHGPGGLGQRDLALEAQIPAAAGIQGALGEPDFSRAAERVRRSVF